MSGTDKNTNPEESEKMEVQPTESTSMEGRELPPTPQVETGSVEPEAATNMEPEQAAANPPVPEGPKFLDLAFAMDCTGSMGSYIHSAQQNIRKIVEDIVSQEKADIRLALVEYRDHPPQDSSFVTRVNDFTGSVRKMKEWLDASSASGGGDQSEAVADALHQVLKLSWRDNATKVCVFIADAPPHGLGCSGDGFPNGCPDGLDPMEIANQLTEKCVSVYMVGCEPSIVPFRDFFMSIAHLTGGQYVPLAAAHLLTRVITGGVQEEMSLQAMMEEVNLEVMEEFSSHHDEVAEDVLTTRIHDKLKAKGVKSKQLYRNQAELPIATSQAQKMSVCTNMADVKDMHVKANPHTVSSGGRSAHSSSRKMKKGIILSGPSGPPPPGLGDSRTRSGATLRTAPPLPGGARAELEAAALAPPAPVSDLGSAGDAYDLVEADIMPQQVQRMVQKAVWSNNLKGRYKKDY